MKVHVIANGVATQPNSGLYFKNLHAEAPLFCEDLVACVIKDMMAKIPMAKIRGLEQQCINFLESNCAQFGKDEMKYTAGAVNDDNSSLLKLASDGGSTLQFPAEVIMLLPICDHRAQRDWLRIWHCGVGCETTRG